MKRQFIGVLGALTLGMSSGHAAELGASPLTLGLEASELTEGNVSTCMLNFRAYDLSEHTGGQVFVTTKLGFILDGDDKEMLHYLSITPWQVTSSEPLRLSPITAVSAHLESGSISTAEDRTAQLPEGGTLSTFFKGDGTAFALTMDMFKNKEVTVAFKREDGRDAKVYVGFMPSDVETPDPELVRYSACFLGLLKQLKEMRGTK